MTEVSINCSQRQSLHLAAAFALIGESCRDAFCSRYRCASCTGTFRSPSGWVPHLKISRLVCLLRSDEIFGLTGRSHQQRIEPFVVRQSMVRGRKRCFESQASLRSRLFPASKWRKVRGWVQFVLLDS